MVESVALFLGLLLVIMGAIMIANKLKIAYPILLVILGLILSLIPDVPNITIDPQLIFIIFLPPLLYEAAWSNSWKELWKWRRIITSFAFLLVFITSAVVAVVANSIIPGFPLALGFLLGGIVSPPDAVSAAAILKFVKVPKRVATILEGESLLNDASSLIVFRFAVLTVTTGQFVWYQAAGSFVWMVVGGLGIGLAIAWVISKLHKILPTDSNMDIIITLISPYLMYIAAEEVHSSGVLATVAGGLFLSNVRYNIFNASTRTRGITVWESYVFVLNGLVFTLIGLDLPQILEGIIEEGVDISDATIYALIITATLMAVRIIAAYGSVVITQIMKRFITVADEKKPGKVAPLVIGWAGMLGVVSLAAALSIPLVGNGEPFPHRNLILYITFVVILLTLIIQGLTLPILIKKIPLPKFDDHLPKEEALKVIGNALSQSSDRYINYNSDDELGTSLAKNRTEFWNILADKNDFRICDSKREKYLSMLDEQREILIELNKNPKIDEEIIRKHIQRIDLEEEKWQHH